MSADIFEPFEGDSSCRFCGGATVVRPRPDTQHYGEIVCVLCSRHNRWEAKPVERKKTRTDTKGLLEIFSNGYCEMCLRSKLPSGTVLQAHHVLPKKDGGGEERENIWILCSMCHKQVHHNRTYLGHYKDD